MRIAIVNDTVIAAEALRRVVRSNPVHQVAWSARDGLEAVDLARKDRPDLILMDMVMPRMDGAEATRRIMAEAPCPILIVTSTVSGHMSRVFEAMGHGALDAVNTPTLGPSGQVEGAGELLEKIEMIGRLAGNGVAKQAALPPAPLARRRESFPLVLLGASTGGPSALAEILAGWPPSWNPCVVIVQHIDAGFAPALARWLTDRSGRSVEPIVTGDRPGQGRRLLAATNDHLVLRPDQRFAYSTEPKELSFRPSVDVFFSSVAAHWPEPGVAALLTGMDRDGAQGMLDLRRRGWHTIAQDESTSIVWGMPRAALELGAAVQVLPLPRIAHAIADRAGHGRQLA